MGEKEVWTVLGRKKVFLVDDDNCVVEELRDLGPLSELEMKWVKGNSGMPYQDWLDKLEESTEGESPEEIPEEEKKEEGEE